MAKGKNQKESQTSQRKGSGPSRSSGEKERRGCCSCIFTLISRLIVFAAFCSLLYVGVFTAYSYNVKQRMPTLDEFKDFSLEMYTFGKGKSIEYYQVAEKHSKVYYAQFERDYLPTIQKYTKEYTKLAKEKFYDFKVFAAKYCAIAQAKVGEYYQLALKKIEEFQSAKPTEAPKKQPAAAPTTTAKPTTTTTTPKPQTTQKATQAPPTTQPPTTTQKPTQAPTPKPTAAPKTTEAPKKAASGGSKEKKEL